MNWLQHHPDDLIERFEPAEALALLRQQTALTPDQLLKLDVYLHHWTLVLLQRANDPEGVQEMLTLCEITSDLAPAGIEGGAMRQRWSGFEDLLEGKRRTLQACRHAPPIQLKQQDTILQIIEQSNGGRVKQQDLAEHLNLSKGRVSQILGVLESRALITRQRQGKESWVSRALTQSAPVSPVQTKASSPALTAVHIGYAVFAKAA
jgi:DNA-binding transcriptional ArsR family regulator